MTATDLTASATATDSSEDPATDDRAADRSGSDPIAHAGALDADVLDADQVRRLRRDDPDVRIIDVRTGGEFETVHIPGAYNIPLDTLREHVRDLADVEHPVVLVCASGARATAAQGTLAAAGKRHLHLLRGGMDAWQAAGGEVVRGGTQRWAMERQVRLVAGSLVLTGIVGSLVAPRLRFLAGAVGAGLTFSAVSNTCAMANVLGRLPYNRAGGPDVDEVLAELRAGT